MAACIIEKIKLRRFSVKKLILSLVLILSLFVTTPVFAQGSDTTKAPGVWVSSINIQNTGTGDAHVVLNFYNAAGTVVLSYTVPDAIAAGESLSLYVPTQIPGLVAGQFSVEVSSDQPLQIVANSSSTGPYTAGAYMGFQEAETSLSLTFPGLYKNYYGFFSEMVLQNTSDVAANITIDFYSQKTGALVVDNLAAAIPAHSSRIFALQDLADVPSGNVNGLLSAVVTSSQNLAGVANIWTANMHGEFSDYNGISSGDTTVFAPALYKNYYNFVSSLTVQNIGAANADIRITYSNGVEELKTLLPFQGFEYYQPNNPLLPSGNVAGVFSAKVESLNAQPIVVLVNVEDKGKGLLASYNGPAGATAATGCPVVMKSFFQWFSAETVQNVGTNPTDITITYANGMTKTWPNVPANGTINIVELATSGSILPDGSSLSAVITSSGEPIVAVVQENSSGRYSTNPGDYLLAYTCIAQP
jgi:hypothetical protein